VPTKVLRLRKLQDATIKSALFIATCCLAVITRSEQQPQLQVVPGEIKDIRSNGKETGKLEVQLKISGDEMPSDAKGCRITVTTAVDETGRDLVEPKSSATDFRAALVNMMLTLELKNPDRKAGHIRELGGEVEVFAPKNDPAATVVVSSFREHFGRPIESEILKAAGLELTPRTGEQYNTLAAKKEADGLKESEAKGYAAIKALEAQTEQQPDNVDLQRQIARLRGSMVSQRETQAFARQNTNATMPNDVVISLKDPNKKLVGFEFRDMSDGLLHSAGSTSSYRQHGSEIEQTRTYHFQSPLPATAKLLIFVATPQALVKVPFALTDIALP